MKTLKYVVFLIALLCGSETYAQMFGGNGYMIGSYVEVAIDGDGGHEGTADWPGHHSRGGFVDVPYGFVADTPPLDGWSTFDGDYFASGTPENGFGMEINGVNYSNNAWNSVTSTAYLKQIPTAPGGAMTYTEDNGCITVEWEGLVAGVRINLKYHLYSNALHYTTEVTLTNESGSPLTDLYYYRNVDPDNNESIGGTFETVNTILDQPDPDCIKAMVSATQDSPRDSYIGMGALGDKFRVSVGGFSNRSGSDIWNALGGLLGTTGSTISGDNAMSLAYKTDLGVGESVNFSFAIVLFEGAVEAAFSSLYFVNYVNDWGLGGGEMRACDKLIINGCRGGEVTLSINGPDPDGTDYDWLWYTGETTDTITTVFSPDDELPYYVIGSPTMPCLSGTIYKPFEVVFSEGPQVYWEDPGLICNVFNLDTLVYSDSGSTVHTHCVFLTEEPTNAHQTEPAFPGPLVYPEDEVWYMCGDTVTGCFDYVLIDLEFLLPGGAGPDTTVTVCGGPGTVVALKEILPDSIVQSGYFYDFAETGRLVDSTGIFNASNIYGTFVFAYILEGLGACPPDTSIITVEIIRSPFALYEYEVNGISSADGLTCTCIVNEVNFFDQSIIEAPGIIVDWDWRFGDGDSSEVMNPSHTYDSPGSYLITLTVTSNNGCKHTHTKRLKIYDTPFFETNYQRPTCHGYSDGYIVVTPDSCLVSYTTEVRDSDGILVNETYPDSAYGLSAGTYTISVEDESGCIRYRDLTISEPPFMEIYYHVSHPSCTGDSGYVVVDSVVGENPNNPVTYEWDPNPANISGLNADSSYWMVAGDYTVTVTDSKGCVNSADFTLIDPPPFYFTEWGFDTAFCRIYSYQSGNGVVYAAAAGGQPNFTYQWTYLVDGSTSQNSTWGGRNPGDHLIEITDAGGCVLSKIITVDSVNPVASFTASSSQFAALGYCYGTADVEVEFTNTSTYWANPNDPEPDTLFLWDLDRTEEEDWIITHDYFEKFDTIYKARGETYKVEVCLIAFNKNLCSDTACKEVFIFEPPVLKTVNIFTPNGGGENEVLSFEHYAKGIRDFNCIIVNRWGVQVGEINSIRGYWDGNNLSGDPCTDGVYFYTYTATADNGKEFAGQGNVTLVRGK